MSRIPQPEDDAMVQYASRWFTVFSMQHKIHCVPVDEREEQTSDQLNRILRDVIGSSVLPRPFPSAQVDEPVVLDCGFGKGAWIDDLLEEFTDCEVTGVDIFLGRGNGDTDDDEEDSDEDGVQEFVKKRWNLNAPFSQDTHESRLRPETFNLINSRLLADGINTDRWPAYVRELKQLLKPGGWLQMVELHLLPQSYNGTLEDSHYLRQWYSWYRHAMGSMNKDPGIGQRLGRIMVEQGFESVRVQSHDLPVGDWNSRLASLGLDFRDVVHELLASRSLVPFTYERAMDAAQYRSLLRGARQELGVLEFKLYYKVYIVIGRRPLRQR